MKRRAIVSGVTFDYSIYGQLIANGTVSGSAYLVSGQAGIREMSAAMGCSSLSSCLVGYRWFNPFDTTTDSDRIKARLVSYP